MMEKQSVVHFGCGALGRGFVIPLLVQSQAAVTAVDTAEFIVESMSENHGYTYWVSDAGDHGEDVFVPIKESLNSLTDKHRLLEVLRNTDLVTTSVRKENLKYIAPVLAEAWKNQDCSKKTVICCENVEDIGSFFQELLVQEGGENLKTVCVPDTVVDRICSMDANGNIVSETFYEWGADSITMRSSPFACLQSMDNLEGHFMRKRFLMNSYADAVSFLGLSKKMNFLYEAAADSEINERIYPYIDQLKTFLQLEYGFEENCLNDWQKLYRQRLSNPRIPRRLETVARNLWQKLSLHERFLYPLVGLKKRGIDIQNGLRFVKELILIDDEGISEGEIESRLQALWCQDPEGETMLAEWKKACGEYEFNR
jgi:mannitol-1-phosphate 5-dehydrogenase